MSPFLIKSPSEAKVCVFITLTNSFLNNFVSTPNITILFLYSSNEVV